MLETSNIIIEREFYVKGKNPAKAKKKN